MLVDFFLVCLIYIFILLQILFNLTILHQTKIITKLFMNWLFHLMLVINVLAHEKMRLRLFRNKFNTIHF